MDFVVLDTETTALPHEGGSIVEIAILEVRNWEVVDRLHFLIKPTTPMTAGAALANGIREKDLVKCPWFKDIEPEVTAYLSMGIPVVAYNGDRFDKEMLRMEYDRLRKQAPNAVWIDAYKIVCDRYTIGHVEEKTGVKSRSQVNMAKYFGVSSAGAHRALADVEILLEIYKKLHEPKEQPLKVNKDHEEKKSKAIENLAKLKVEVVAVKAIAAASALSITVSEKVIEFALLTVTDNNSNEAAAKAITSLSNLKKEAVSTRLETLSKLKSVVTSIEEMFRDWVTKPIDRASETLSASRQLYIKKQYEKRVEEANRQKEEIEKLAQETAQKIFDAVKLESGTDAAVLKSEKVYSDIAREALAINAETKTETKTGSAKVVDKIVFDIEVVDASVIPKKWLIPDLEGIKKYVNETNGDISIAGVLITARAESKISRR